MHRVENLKGTRDSTPNRRGHSKQHGATAFRWLRHERSRFMVLMLAPAILILFAVTIYPTLVNMYQSLFDYELTHPDERHFIFLKNYVDLLLHNDRFLNAAKITFYYVGLVLTAELLLGFGIASILSGMTLGRGLVTTLIVLPMAAAPVAITFIWRFMYNPSVGIFGYLLESVGLPQIQFLSDARWVIPSLAMVDIWQWTPFMVLILTAGLMSLPQEPFEAATVDGASKWQELWYLGLPMMRPFILVALLFRGIDAFKTFDYIYILTKGGPGTASETLNLRTFQTGIQFLHMGEASAMAILMLIVIIIFSKVLIGRMQASNLD